MYNMVDLISSKRKQTATVIINNTYIQREGFYICVCMINGYVGLERDRADSFVYISAFNLLQCALFCN